MRLAFEIDVPDGAVDKSTEAELTRSVKELTVLKLYAERRITARDVAEMLGMSQIQLQDPVGSNSVQLPPELHDVEVFGLLERWHKQRNAKSMA